MPQNTQDSTESSRRDVLKTAVAIAGAGAMGYYADSVTAATPSGTFPADTEDPLLKIRADRLRLVPRTSDPSTPDDGTIWYRGDL